MQKKIMNAILVAIAVIAMALGGNFCEAGSIHDEYPARLVDTSNTLSQQDKTKIQEKLEELHNSGKAEMVVVLVPSLEGQSIEEFSMDISERWKIGKKDVDNGLLLVLAKEEHKMRLEVGRGLEGTITDGAAGEVLDRMKPALKKGDFTSAILTGVSDVDLKLSGESIAKNQKEKSDFKMIAEGALTLLVWLLLIGYLFAWPYSAYEAQYLRDYRDKGFLRRLFSIYVMWLAVCLVANIAFEILINILINLPAAMLSDGGGSSSSDSSFSSGGFFDGGGSSDDW